VLPNAKDDSEDDDDTKDAPAPMIFGKRHERRDECKDIEYKQQMLEAMCRSIEDCGR